MKLILACLFLTLASYGQSTFTYTIANGASTTAEINLPGDCRLATLTTPAAWTSASLTFLVSRDGGTTFNQALNESNAVLTLTVTVDSEVILPYYTYFSFRRFKLQSGTKASAVAQGAERTFKVTCMPR